jgi:hypothetical protein
LRTQRRWIQWVACLLGLLSELGPRRAEQVATTLAVAGLIHEQARKAYRESTEIRTRADAILSVLSLVAIDTKTVSRLLGVGTITGALGSAYLWSCERGRREFPAGRTVSLDQNRGPPEEATKSVLPQTESVT